MTRCLFLLVVATFAVGTTGCQCCNWFRSPCAAPAAPPVTYGVPAAPVVTPGAPVLPPAGVPAAGSAGYTAYGSAQPVAVGPQGYVPAPTVPMQAN